jgi:hypothetical protein
LARSADLATLSTKNVDDVFAVDEEARSRAEALLSRFA